MSDIERADALDHPEWLSWNGLRGHPYRAAVALFAVVFGIWHIATNVYLSSRACGRTLSILADSPFSQR